jgi:hypothetical protein
MLADQGGYFLHGCAMPEAVLDLQAFRVGDVRVLGHSVPCCCRPA